MFEPFKLSANRIMVRCQVVGEYSEYEYLRVRGELLAIEVPPGLGYVKQYFNTEGIAIIVEDTLYKSNVVVSNLDPF